ncbi:DUF3919 family protein [Halarsenatibacter silvermanii]|uniref:Uncharacterized protein n=1 Tax=Halarsenatibacter silvermanii TaxID=321763 RepID=A0A1G9QF34_9FIRM|nr:DUF3919 family protein [Halarsenatibacter silvermanii]SDM09682.1 Protein of unknown function [Halarsenatibacter silvermanii]
MPEGKYSLPILVILTLMIVLTVFMINGRGEVLPEGELVTVDEDEALRILENQTPIELKISDLSWGPVVIRDHQQVLEIWNLLRRTLPEGDLVEEEQQEKADDVFRVEVTFLNEESREFTVPIEYLQEETSYTRSFFQ